MKVFKPSFSFRNWKIMAILFFPLQWFFFSFIGSYPHFIENWYSNGLFKYVSPFLRGLTAWIPFSVGETLLYIVIVFVIFRLAWGVFKLVKRQIKFKSFVLKSLFSLLAWTSVIYFLFMVLWGLNYHREPLVSFEEIRIKKQDFKNQDFKKQDFKKQDFENQEIKKQDFKNQDFENQEIKNQDFKNQDFENQEIKNQEIKNQDFKKQDFKKQDFKNQDFKKQDFKKQDFKKQDFKKQDFENQEIKKQDFKNQDFENQEIKNQEIKNQDFKSQDLKRKDAKEIKFSTKELIGLCEKLIEETNSSRVQAVQLDVERGKPGMADEDIVRRAYSGFHDIYIENRKLDYNIPSVKSILFTDVFSYLGVGGIYNPFTGEANVNMDPPDFLLPATICHEMAHQAGIAPEDEANYVAYVVCRQHPDPFFQYSGYLMAMRYAMGALKSDNRIAYDELRKEISEGVQSDLEENHKYWSRFKNPFEKYSDKVYDQYLKANKQQAGIKSYSRMVRLLLYDYRKKEGAME